MHRDYAKPLATNRHLLRWVDKMRELVRPAGVHWVDGSQEENDELCDQMVQSGTFQKLNDDLWPGCFYARSDPNDVARVEQRTFVCSLSKDNAGPTNNWVNPYEMRGKLREIFSGAMAGRTMYVLAYSMGPIGSPMSQIGVQLTDSPYVVVSMRIMARIGLRVLKEIDKNNKRVVPCIHSVGAPLAPGQQDSTELAIRRTGRVTTSKAINSMASSAKSLFWSTQCSSRVYRQMVGMAGRF